MAIVKASSRFFQVQTRNNGDILEFGPAATQGNVGTFTFQFAPSADFVGSFTVLGKVFGVAADSAPFMAIPYRRVNVGAAVSDYLIVADLVSAAGIIQVPANGLTIGMLTTCTVGSCQIYSWDMQGPSAV